MHHTPEQAKALAALREQRTKYDDWRFGWTTFVKNLRAHHKQMHMEQFEDLAYEAEAAGCSIAQIAEAYGTSNWKTANTLVSRATKRKNPKTYASDEARDHFDQD